MAKIDITKHVLVPKHSKLSEKELKDLLEKYNVTPLELPKISRKDPAIAHLDAKVGDVVKITRDSPTAKVAYFYRCVVNV